MKKSLFITYCLGVTILFTLVSIANARTINDSLAAFIYLPLVFFFFKELVRRTSKRSADPEYARGTTSQPAKQESKLPAYPITKEQIRGSLAKATVPERGRVMDADRRIFLKLIGSAGLSLFMLALFTKKAQAAFFGSVPGPGVVALKDTAGNKIDPALHHPTAGYKISRLDDTSSATYAYFGFVNKTGAWYLQREQLTGADAGQYLFSAASSDFATAWTNRVSPTPAYNTFDNIF